MSAVIPFLMGGLKVYPQNTETKNRDLERRVREMATSSQCVVVHRSPSGSDTVYVRDRKGALLGWLPAKWRMPVSSGHFQWSRWERRAIYLARLVRAPSGRSVVLVYDQQAHCEWAGSACKLPLQNLDEEALPDLLWRDVPLPSRDYLAGVVADAGEQWFWDRKAGPKASEDGPAKVSATDHYESTRTMWAREPTSWGGVPVAGSEGMVRVNYPSGHLIGKTVSVRLSTENDNQTGNFAKTEKEIKMNNRIKHHTNVNLNAVQSAAYLEAARIANNKLAEVASKQAPLMLKGYAQTPLARLLFANIVSIALTELRPNDAKLAQLSRSMVTEAYGPALRALNIEGLINGMVDAVKDLPDVDMGLAE